MTGGGLAHLMPASLRRIKEGRASKGRKIRR